MTGVPSSDRRTSTWLIILGIVLVSLNLRPAIVSVAPLLDVIRTSLELSSAAVSLLTTVPVMLIGVFALSVPLVVSRLGYGGGVRLGVVLIGLGTAARLGGELLSVLLVTTLLVGIGIGITQALLPPIVKLYFPERVAFGTGLYTVSLTVGATLASGTTVPLERVLDSWPGALAVWAVLAGMALLAWRPVRRGLTRNPPPSNASATSHPTRSQGLWRHPFVWTLTLFYVFNTALYYSMLTWLPPRYIALGWSETAAGLILTVFIVAGLGGMLLITIAGDRTADRRHWLGPVIALALVGTVGVTAVPDVAPWFWAASLGFGVGAWFTLMLMLPVDYTASSEATSRLSAVAIAGGYVIGGAAPFAVGLLRDLYGGFTVPFGGLTAFIVLALVLSVRFRPDRNPGLG
ncbi:CynX/NimT family MFS transporter [Natrononativus amylolyticus]|uniref:MFS transporter n=1 Tax=Natrononativus amylolyticus TaxID=2963434 RepID=UPI0020CEC7F5|nr:MFS transporter [Natrononativus amylolyticus]